MSIIQAKSFKNKFTGGNVAEEVILAAVNNGERLNKIKKYRILIDWKLGYITGKFYNFNVVL